MTVLYKHLKVVSVLVAYLLNSQRFDFFEIVILVKFEGTLTVFGVNDPQF